MPQDLHSFLCTYIHSPDSHFLTSIALSPTSSLFSTASAMDSFMKREVAICEEEDEDEVCRTPKGDENKIPQALAPPPPPRKQRKDQCFADAPAGANEFFQSPDVEAFFAAHKAY